MLGQRKLGLLNASTWPESLVEEFIVLLGSLHVVGYKNLYSGVSEENLLSLSVEDSKYLNCPSYSRKSESKSILICENFANPILWEWFSDVHKRQNAFDMSAENHFRESYVSRCEVTESIWSIIALAATAGMRLPSEHEWEAAVFRSESFADQDLAFQREVQRVRATASSQSDNQVSPRYELTSSLGFSRDPRAPGKPIDDWIPSASLYKWPGVIVRGCDQVSTNLFSRFSHRFGGAGFNARLVLEASALDEMDDSPFKDAIVSNIVKGNMNSGSLLSEYRY